MKTTIERFEDLLAWRQARALVGTIYRASGTGPWARDYSLRNQIRDAAISVPSNIAEGFERYRPREFHQFLSISKASCAEVRSDLYLARDLDYIDDTALNALLGQASEAGRIIGSLRSSVARQFPDRKP
jgi:four helix bundle protein